MPRYNTNFELSIEDMELIEAALLENKKSLSVRRIAQADKPAEEDGTIRKISELLGRLHNQKEFFRPRHGVYLGG